jgi:hypothetical protein
MLDEFMAMAPLDPEDGPSLLVMIAGLIGEDFPWIRELLLDAARELRGCDPGTAAKIVSRLSHMIHLSTRHPMIMELDSSKEAHMMAIELPRIIEHVLSRYQPTIRKSANQDVNHPDESTTKELGARIRTGFLS